MNKSETMKLALAIIDKLDEAGRGLIRMIDERIDQRLRAVAGSFAMPGIAKVRAEKLEAPDLSKLKVKLPKARRKAPKQLCPAPRCKNPAAPSYGMLCSKHKDVPRATVRAWREARRARKANRA